MGKYPGVESFTCQPPPKVDVKSSVEGGNNHLYHLPYTEPGGQEEICIHQTPSIA